MPPIPSTTPPFDVIPPELVSTPFWIVPPASVTELIVCVRLRPPRSSVPPALTVVTLTALNAFVAPPRSVPAATVVGPE